MSEASQGGLGMWAQEELDAPWTWLSPDVCISGRTGRERRTRRAGELRGLPGWGCLGAVLGQPCHFLLLRRGETALLASLDLLDPLAPR